ncbi:MAG: DEAD/DEAH box helicase [Clostridia bacterium]
MSVNKDEYKNFKQIVNIFYNEEVERIDTESDQLKKPGTIRIEPKIFYDKFSGDMKIEFKIGNKKMYKIKNLAEFYTRMMNKEFYRYGEKLQFVHIEDVFEEDSKKILNFIMKYAEIIKYANSNSNSNYKYYGKALSETSIIVGNSAIDDLFDVLKEKKIAFQKDYTICEIEFTEKQPKIEFKLKKINKEHYAIIPNIEIYKVNIIKGKNYKYILDDENLYRCTKEFENSNLKLLELFRQNYMTEVKLGKDELTQLFSIIVPKVKNAITLENISEEEIEQYKPKELIVKVFLDFDKNDYLIADVKFCYGEKEINPLDEKQKIDFPRNKIEETKALNIFRQTSFMLDTKNLRFILPDNDKIYDFLTQDINYYMQRFEVLVTDNFRKKQIREPKIGKIGVRIENNLLSVDLSNLDIDSKELEGIIKKYALKKKYYRLKDGSFIDLRNSKEVEFLDKLATGLDIDYKELENGEVRLPAYRSLYLNQLLKGIKGTEVVKNSEYKTIVNQLNKEQLEEDIKVPENLNTILRYYQKTGFKWLKILDHYKFGGILADDMGLGKTIQMLSVIVDYIQNSNQDDMIPGQEQIGDKKRASLVVSPSSLTLNWQNEATKFTNELKTMVIRGTLSERKRQIEEIENYDLVITSYDLLKRDIELYKKKDYQFRFIVADEAQYLKNSNTQNAKSMKQIKADTKYALTGTPIENSLAELWSIFDFIMPGYLFSYRKFKNVYETPIVKDNDEKVLEKLKMLIEPFVLRRNKKQVLTELPDKTVTVLNNEMGEEQRNIYLSYLLEAKQELTEQIELNGYENTHMQILAALTRLRQICCHPSLFIDGYQAGSSKLEQCIEIIEEAANGGHKILLFSGYTSMFELIEKELEKRNIRYFKLTGATKVDERIKLVDEFNDKPEIKVFLISLKAGGTGLNLTGADMVIHYDPWWNISTENQATDRAYRIGQKNNVQVYKLITKDSIEEKIYELQERKAELADNMLDTKTTFINKLSKDEIMNLFE